MWFMMNHRLILFMSLLFYSLLVEGQSLKIDSSSLSGKIMCGYQGWFNCEGDGAELGWTHWARNRRTVPGPGNVTVDLWPDLSEYGPEERFATSFRLADGTPAEVLLARRLSADLFATLTPPTPEPTTL
jgi:hypothetical protein